MRQLGPRHWLLQRLDPGSDSLLFTLLSDIATAHIVVDWKALGHNMVLGGIWFEYADQCSGRRGVPVTVAGKSDLWRLERSGPSRLYYAAGGRGKCVREGGETR